MEAFFAWMRKRFTMVDLAHLADVEDETLQSMVMENGPSRDEFLKLIVFKLLLDIDSDSDRSKEHNLEKIFVTFGLLSKEVAQKFLKGDMPTNEHIATWKRIIGVLIPITTISSDWSSYDEMINFIHGKNYYFNSIANKNVLPPELISKVKVDTVADDNIDESLENVTSELLEILKKPVKSFERRSNERLLNSEKQPLISLSSEPTDLDSVKNEIDQYNKISKENSIVLPNNQCTTKMSLEELAKLAEKLNLFENDHLESKVQSIYKLVRAENDLQLLAKSLANQG